MFSEILNVKSKAVVVVAGLVCSVAIPTSAQVTKMEGGELLPPNAKAGECYARIFVPPTYTTVTEQAMKREESERVQIIPAKTQTGTERVLVSEASSKLEVVPATYGWVEETMLVSPASKKLVEVPATYKTVTERVMDKPAHTIWKKGKGPIQAADNATGEIMCLVDVPATYKSITKTVLVTPASTREVAIPAEYTTIKKRVMKTPPSTREIKIPAEYKTVQVTKVVTPAQEQRFTMPAQYQTVQKTVQVSEGRMEWQTVLCETNATPHAVMAIQRALQNAGYRPGNIDGVVGQSTMNAVRSFQKAKGLPVGQLTMETITALGVNL
jgi:hypothetical protein